MNLGDTSPQNVTMDMRQATELRDRLEQQDSSIQSIIEILESLETQVGC